MFSLSGVAREGYVTLPRKLLLVWNYVSVMPSNLTVRVDEDDGELRIPVVAVPNAT